MVVVPAFGYQRPHGFGNLQPLQIFLLVDCSADQLQAHGLDFSRGLFDLTFDFLQAERVIRPLVPITLAVDGVKVKPGLSAVKRQSSRSGQGRRCIRAG